MKCKVIVQGNDELKFEKKDIDFPDLLTLYYQSMGGTDAVDFQLSRQHH